MTYSRCRRHRDRIHDTLTDNMGLRLAPDEHDGPLRNPRIKSPLLCVRRLPNNAWRCRIVRGSAHFAAVWYRALSDGTATSEQTWSKHGDGHVPKRQIRSVITPASVAAS